LQLRFAAAVMTRLLLPSKILMHLLAGRFSSRSIKHPDAVLQAEHVDIVNDRVSAAVLDAMNAETIARAVVENCMLEKLDGVESPVLLR
jgi:cobalamin biosynthesis protein CobD/CbiB